MPSDDDVLPESRTERLARRRRRRWGWAAIAAGVALLGGAGTVVAITLSEDAASTQTHRPSETIQDETFGDVELPELRFLDSDDSGRSLSHDDPLRLWVGGDSLAGALGPALGELTAATGIVATQVDYKISSGLASNVRNWRSTGEDAMEEADPEVVAFMIGANDVAIVNSHDGDDDGIPDWEPDYRDKVAEMMDILVGENPGRVVLWIGTPTMRTELRNRGAVELNRVMREEARTHAPEVVYVDAYRLFSDENGDYSDTVETANGDTLRVRIGDGVHFTSVGAEYLARAVFALIDARFEINAQADPENRISYTVRQGGGSSGGSDGRGARTSPSTATTPTTATDDTTDDTTDDDPTTPVPTTATTAPPTIVTSPPTTIGEPPPSTSPTTIGVTVPITVG
ncbi:MAG: DUF459 domain-containing protein [Actinomycetota bacterium]